MAWIELHQGLHRHRKIVELARPLDVPRMSAVGHITALWCWALDNAPEGDLSCISKSAVALGAEWEGDPEAFWNAAVDAGFIDENGQIHDWHAYAGKLVDRRKADAERKRRQREVSAGHPQDILKMSVATVPYPTVPNSTEKRGETPLTPLEGGDDGKKKEKKVPMTPEFLEEMVQEWGPQLGGEERTREIIAHAMNHKARNKNDNQQLYLRGWLRRDAEKFNGSRNGHIQQARQRNEEGAPQLHTRRD